MELGATICTPKKPLCLLCPWKSECKSVQTDLVGKLPLTRPKQKGQIWLWELSVAIRNNRIYLEPNGATPFLSNMYFPKGKARLLAEKPKKFDLRHSVTKYDIYVKLKNEPKAASARSNWFDLKTIRQINHSSLMTKILKKLE
jgi:A/G-specific adenine glycosylase